MDHNPDRIALWPGYFDAKASRRSGRRVPKDSSVLKPDLEGLFIASRALGLKKIKREERVSHPNRPHGKEGRLWVSKKGAQESIGAALALFAPLRCERARLSPTFGPRFCASFSSFL